MSAVTDTVAYRTELFLDLLLNLKIFKIIWHISVSELSGMCAH